MKALKIAVVIGFCLLTACNNNQKTNKVNSTVKADQIKDCIAYILKQDDSLGTVRNHNCEKIPLSNAIKQYVNSVDNLNFENCASEFKQAFKNHMKAWSKMQHVTDSYPNMRGEMHNLFDSIEKTKDSTEFKRFLKDIWDTWEAVEKTKTLD